MGRGKQFVFVERLRCVICLGPGRGEKCPFNWTKETRSATMRRCPKCQCIWNQRQKRAKERVRKFGSAALLRPARTFKQAREEAEYLASNVW